MSLEGSIEKDIKHTTMSLLLQAIRRMSRSPNSSIKVNDNMYMKDMFQLEAGLWLIGNLKWGQHQKTS